MKYIKVYGGILPYSHPLSSLSSPSLLPRSPLFPQLSFMSFLDDPDALSFFSPAAFHYFYPSYMLACIVHGKAAGKINSVVLRNFSPPTRRDDLRKLFRKNLQCFSVAQLNIILTFFDYMHYRPSNDLRKAIKCIKKRIERLQNNTPDVELYKTTEFASFIQ